MNTTRLASFRPAALFAAAALTCTVAFAGGAEKSQARAEALKYRQACLAGETHQDRATCLKEANNFLAELKRNPGQFQNDARFQANALARCEPLSGIDRAACVARVGGHGTVSGSVESGGIYRELTTVQVHEPVPVIIQGAETAPATAADSPATQ